MSNYTKQECGIAEVMMCRYIEGKFNNIEPWVEESIEDVVEDYGGEDILNLISYGNSLEAVFDDIVGSSLYHLASSFLTFKKGEEEEVKKYLAEDFGKLDLECKFFDAPQNIGCRLKWIWMMFVLISGDEEIIAKVNKDLVRCGVTAEGKYLCANHREKCVNTMQLPMLDNQEKHYKSLANQVSAEIYAYRSDIHTINHATNYEDVVALNKKISYEFFKLLAEYGFDFVMDRTNTMDIRFVDGVATFVFTETLTEMARDLDNILLSLVEEK